MALACPVSLCPASSRRNPYGFPRTTARSSSALSVPSRLSCSTVLGGFGLSDVGAVRGAYGPEHGVISLLREPPARPQSRAVAKEAGGDNPGAGTWPSSGSPCRGGLRGATKLATPAPRRTTRWSRGTCPAGIWTSSAKTAGRVGLKPHLGPLVDGQAVRDASFLITRTRPKRQMVSIHRTRQREVEPSQAPTGVAREASTQSKSAGAAARLLRSEKHWGRRTWRHFEHTVLTTLRERGAHSVDELAEEPPEVLFVPMVRDELAAALDSARRRGLVEPLGHSRRPGGQDAHDEWTLTKEGSRSVRTGLSWLVGSLGLLGKVVVSIAGVLGALGLTNLGELLGLTDFISRPFEVDQVPVFWIVGVLELVAVAAGALLWVRAKVIGVSAQRAVAKDWARWGEERPEWRRTALQAFPWLWAIVAVPGVVVVGTASLVPPESWPVESDLHIALSCVALVAAIPAAVKVPKWLFRWSAIRDDAQKRRGNMAPAEETNEDASFTTERQQPAAAPA